MTRFQLALTGTCLFSGWWFAQFAASFPIIRTGCIVIILGGVLWIAVDAFMDKAKTEAEGWDGDLLTIITPHIAHAVMLLFLVIVGVYVGW